MTKCKDQLQIITDMAFEAVDEDGSGGLDVEEIQVVME